MLELCRRVNRPQPLIFVWLFSALVMVALLSQPGSSDDEWVHVSSIWCGQGNRSPYCVDQSEDEFGARISVTNVDGAECAAKPQSPLLCVTPGTGKTTFLREPIFDGRLFYFVLSWFALTDTDLGVLLIRIVNALVISTFLAVLSALLPSRYLLVVLLMIITSLTISGFILFASVNPSSWMLLGVGFGWIPIHAALAPGPSSPKRRLTLATVGATGWIMAVGSTFESIGYIAFSVALITAHVLWLRRPPISIFFNRLLIVIALVFVLVIELCSSWFGGRLSNIFTTYPTAFRSLAKFPSANEALASPVPVEFPTLIFVGAVAMLGYFVARTFNRSQPLQIVGTLLTFVAISITTLSSQGAMSDADVDSIKHWESLPAVILAIGWWYLASPDDLRSTIGTALRPASGLATVLFALTSFTVAERYVDRQTFGLRFLPDGMDEWWWSFIPFSPNVVVFLAPLFLWRFLDAYTRRTIQSNDLVRTDQ